MRFRLNIRQFMKVPNVQEKGAGAFRDKPNTDRKKDHRRDVKSSPGYKLSLEYGRKEGDRINNHHLYLKQKGA